MDDDPIMRGFHALQRDLHRTADSDRKPTSEALVFGRSTDCDVRVDDEYVSPRHCRIWRDGNGFWVEDLGSTNGTYMRLPQVGGEIKVYGPTPIPAGATIRIGRTQLPWST